VYCLLTLYLSFVSCIRFVLVFGGPQKNSTIKQNNTIQSVQRHIHQNKQLQNFPTSICLYLFHIYTFFISPKYNVTRKKEISQYLFFYRHVFGLSILIMRFPTTPSPLSYIFCISQYMCQSHTHKLQKNIFQSQKGREGESGKTMRIMSYKQPPDSFLWLGFADSSAPRWQLTALHRAQLELGTTDPP
jgi:hypothetical protein